MTDYAEKFRSYSTADLIGQLRLEAREKLDPEFEAFLSAVADRLQHEAGRITLTRFETMELFGSFLGSSVYDPADEFQRLVDKAIGPNRIQIADAATPSI